MIYATRAQCEQAVRDRGGLVVAAPRQRTNFLVVGPIASEAWIQSTHGRKLLAAADLRAAGIRIHIIPEEHWLLALETGA